MKIKYLFLIGVLFTGCKDKYMPNLHLSTTGYLVVEGFINVGKGPTHIQLSRSTGLDSPYYHSESGAQIEVQSENGASYPLAEQAGGQYSIDQLPVNSAQRYRLHIRTNNGKDFISDYTEIKITPLIDTVKWKAESDGVSIFVSTHDNQNKTIYYQWQFEETWKYTAYYQSNYKYENHILSLRSFDEFIFTCWKTDVSTNIAIASSAKLKSDVISDFPLTHIPYYTSEKLAQEYSIQVKQYALSKEWYEWKQKVKKNTEQLGSIFDAQPSETGGNIHCTTDPNEIAIGFIGCTTETDKRIFIDNSELNVNITNKDIEFCKLDTINYYPPDFDAFLYNTGKIPVNLVYVMGVPKGVEISFVNCADCRAKGGTNIKPDFWP